MTYDKKIEAKNQGYAGLLRCNEVVNKIFEAIKTDEKTIGWDKVVRSGVVKTGLEVLQTTIFQELGFIEEDEKKCKKTQSLSRE